MVKIRIYLTIFIFIALDFFSYNIYANNLIDFVNDDIIAIITSDNESEFLYAIEVLSDYGGIIYIDTPVISLINSESVKIYDNFRGGIIGIRQDNGEYPRIDFMRGNHKKESAGLCIYGSNKFIEYIIIENASDDGIIIMSDNNIIDHVISRYNFGSGFFVCGNFNILTYCYAYRNYDVEENYILADGFHIYGEVNNTLNYCFAWDNANSGFSFDNSALNANPYNSSELNYLHCGSWNNGNLDVFTGKYDYDNGNPLDKNLWTIKEIMKSDSNYVSNYYNKKYNIDDAYLEGLPVKNWVEKLKIIYGNGFSFKTYSGESISDVKRNILYCISFDHKSGGFIDKSSHRYNSYVANCISFNNDINYKLPYTFSKWLNNWSWGANNKDQLNKVTTNIPNNIDSIQRSIYSVREQIIKAVFANMFPDGVNFDNSISRLGEYILCL